MQIAIIVIIAVVAVVLVIAPLVRGERGLGAGDIEAPERPGAHRAAGEDVDEDERVRGGGLSVGSGRPEPQSARSAPERAASIPPDPDGSPAPSVPPLSAPQPPGETATEELPQAAPPPPGPVVPGSVGDPRTEAEILQYREALRARTICPSCSAANPPGSRFCKMCGARLAEAGA